MVKKSLLPFLDGVIDYAGLYPPAKLSLPDAFQEFVGHSKSEQSWMLSKFVIGSDLLGQLGKLYNESKKAPIPLDLTIVSKQTGELGEFKKEITNVVKNIADFYKNTIKEVRLSSLEVKLPSEVLYSNKRSDLIEAIDYCVRVMSKSKALPHQVFFEIPGFDFDPKLAEVVLQVISAHNLSIQNEQLPHYTFSGFKIRCGGVEAHQFPPAHYVAAVLIAAREENVPLKFTAGLHHPVRHYNKSVQTKMHGFLNVFGASILSYTQDLSEDEINLILNDEDAGNFLFTDDYFAWKDLAAPLLEIKMLRMLSATSFGSCSFDEPVEDLQSLKLLN